MLLQDRLVAQISLLGISLYLLCQLLGRMKVALLLLCCGECYWDVT